MLMYTVLDFAAKVYLPPFCVPSERDAKHQFENAVLDPQTSISKYPADYTLYQIGEFDQRSGILTKLDLPLPIVNAAVYVKEKTNE